LEGTMVKVVLVVLEVEVDQVEDHIIGVKQEVMEEEILIQLTIVIQVDHQVLMVILANRVFKNFLI